MAYSRKIILLTLLFICVAFFVKTFAGKPENVMAKNSKVIDLPVKGWLCKPINSSQAVLDTLETDVTVFADYSRLDENMVNLYVGYYDTIEQSKMSHAPQVCFTAQGWIMKKNDRVPLTLRGERKMVNRLLLEKNEDKILVYYWYQSGDEVFADIFRMKIALLFKKIRAGTGFNEGNAFVRIYTRATKSQQSAKLLLQKFANVLSDSLLEMNDRKLKQ